MLNFTFELFVEILSLIILSSKSSECLYQMATGENVVGSKRGEREREKESSRLAE
jgi:hypothetical protein